MPDDLTSRVDALERLQTQQERLNALLIDITGRLNQEQALHAERLARLDAVLAAIKDLLERGNGH